MLVAIPYFRSNSLKLNWISLKPLYLSSLSYSTQPFPPASSIPIKKLNLKGFGLTLSEEFGKKIKLHRGAVKELVPASVGVLSRYRDFFNEEESCVNELDILTKLNKFVIVINELNASRAKRIYDESYVLNIHRRKEMEQLIVSLCQSQFNTCFLKWVIVGEVFSPDAFYGKQDQILFVRVLSRACLDYSVFSKWDDFGGAFQNFVIQVWNNLLKKEASDLCDGIVNQVVAPLKERAYNSVLECFRLYILPNYSVGVGNRLLVTMVELGFTPSSSAYDTIIGLNIAVSHRYPKNLEKRNCVKTIHACTKNRRSSFSSNTLDSLLRFYSANVNDISNEDTTLFELARSLVMAGDSITKMSSLRALDAVERHIERLRPGWRNQKSASMNEERVKFILEEATQDKAILTFDVFNVLLTCYYNLSAAAKEEKIIFVSNLFQKIMTLGAFLERSHLEVLLRFYSNLGYTVDFDQILQVLDSNNLTLNAKILYATLDCHVFKGQAKAAASIYSSLTGGAYGDSEANSRIKQSPNVLSLMIIASAKLNDLSAMKMFWKCCYSSTQAVSSLCYQNAIRGFTYYTAPSSIALSSTEFTDAFSYLMSIKKELKTNPPNNLSKVYSKLLIATSEYCIVCPDAKFNDFWDTITVCVFEFKQGHSSFCYESILTACKAFVKRDPTLKPILIAEAEKLIREILKYYIRTSCNTYYQLLTLIQILEDHFLFNLTLEQFRFMLMKKHIIDPNFASRVLDLAKK